MSTLDFAVQGFLKNLGSVAEDSLLQRLPLIEREAIVRDWGHDPWLCNYFVNLWEYLRGEEELTSYPYNVTIPVADVCNARCTFCTSWLEGTKVLAVADVDKFAEVLAHARVLGLAGHGEPLSHPHCEELFTKIAGYLDPRCQAYLITNGVFLEKRRAALSKINVTTYNISLNAATPETHDRVMGLGPDAFDSVMRSVRELLRVRDNEKPAMDINISLVINHDNVHELADFVELGNSLGVNKIYLRTLTSQSSLPVGLNYHSLPPYLHPNFETYAAAARAAIGRSRSQIITDPDSWGAPVFSSSLQQLIAIQPPAPVDRKQALGDKATREFYATYYDGYDNVLGLGNPLELPPGADPDLMEDGTNPFQRSAQLHCTFVYQDFIINDFNMRVIPCCYMASVPGFDLVRYEGSRPFFDYWNSPAFRTIRRTLRTGPLYGACKKCPAQPPPSLREKVPSVLSRGVFSSHFDHEGSELFANLQHNILGDAGSDKAVKLTDDGIVFTATTSGDHLATPFFDVSQGGRWLRFRCTSRHPAVTLRKCPVQVQDDSYTFVFPIETSGGEADECDSYYYLKLADSIKSVRLIVYGRDRMAAQAPWRLQIEQETVSAQSTSCGG